MCRLFGSCHLNDAFGNSGFSDFHNITRALDNHERSKIHIANELVYHARSKQVNTLTLDASFVNQSAIEREYWKSILKRIVAVIKFLGSRGLAFRGSNGFF